MSRIHVIGMSPGFPLSKEAREALMRSKSILASERLYGLLIDDDSFPLYRDRVTVINKVESTIETLKKTRSESAVLASGDPMFFGIGKRITEEFEGREVLMYPALSSLQLAFSRAGLSWHDAFLVSFHGSGKRRWTPADLPLLCERHEKLAILTGGENTPSTISAHLPGSSAVWVAERLGYSDERIRKAKASGLRRMKFREPNVMIVESHRTSDGGPVMGLNENEFRHRGGLITKDEVRAVVLHKLRLPLEGVLWDIGAGSGSVSIEAKKLSPLMDAYAIEKDPARSEDIKSNALSLRAGEINVVQGAAPSALLNLPAPDRVFIGGSGASLPSVIKQVIKRINKGGVIVVTAITLESMEAARASLEGSGLSPEITQVAVSRSSRVGQGNYMKALNPVFIIKVNT